MAVRSGTGKIVKFFMDKSKGDNVSKLNAECQQLSDEDIVQLSTGIENGTLTY
jgi:hypothetical protein